MNNTCFNPSCPNRPEFICHCFIPNILTCSAHLAEHMASVQTMNHNINPLFHTFTQPETKNILKEMQFLLYRLQEARNSLIQFLTNLTTQFNKSLSALKIAEKNIKKDIQVLISKNRVFIPTNSRNEFIQIIEKSQIMDFYSSSLKKFDTKNIEEELRALKKFFKHETLFDNAAEEELFLINNRNTLIHFNKNTEKVTDVYIHSQFNRECSSICHVNNHSILVYGGYRQQPIGSTLLVNVIEKSVQVLPDGLCRAQTTGQKAMGKIFYFSGCHLGGGNFTKNSQCFHLKKLTWQDICDFPFATRNISTLSMQFKILTTTTDCFFVLYDIKKDAYERFDLDFEILPQNILFKSSGFVYLLNNQGILRINERLKEEWVFVGNCNLLWTVNSKPVKSKNGMVYFSDCKGLIYKFDPESQTIIQLF